jgi:hypothetical protein
MVKSSSDTSPIAYRVPWQVDRRQAPTYHLVNRSTEPLRGVTFDLTGAAIMRAPIPRTVQPSESLTLTILGHDLARDTILLVRWFKPGGDEYLWRVSF